MTKSDKSNVDRIFFNGFVTITCWLLQNPQNIIIGGAQVPIVIFILSLMVVCKIIALKDGIMHNHWGSISIMIFHSDSLN